MYHIQKIEVKLLSLTAALFVGAALAFLPSFALADHEADTNEDGFISTAEGVPFYGGIVHSLTTDGDVSPDSALALD